MPDEVPSAQILLYQTEDRCTRIEVQLENETVWLNQLQIGAGRTDAYRVPSVPSAARLLL